MPRYPERVVSPNAFQIAGAAAQDVGGRLGQFADKQQQLRASVQMAIEKRKAANLARLEAEDRKRREDAELKLRQDREAREAKAPQGWKPANMVEAVEFERKKAEAINASKPAKTSDSEIARREKRAAAERAIPAVWSRLEPLHGQQPKASWDGEGNFVAGDPKYNIKDSVDPLAGQKLFRQDFEAWRRNVKDLQDQLNRAEVDWGGGVTKFPLGNVRLQDLPSYRLFRSGPAIPSAAAARPAPTRAPQAPASSSDEDISAFLSANGYEATPEAIATVRQRLGGAQ
jgi:hypothetical protein